MKKLFAGVLSAALLLSMMFIPMSVSAADSLLPANGISWNGITSVKSQGNYMRTKPLSDGTIAGTWYVSGKGVYFGKSYDGGLTFDNEVLVAANTSDTVEDGRGSDGYGRIEVQNPNIIQMTDGKLMMTYRYNTFTGDTELKPWSTYYTSICYKLSTDGGETWSEPVVVKESVQPGGEGGHGYWEPEPVYIGDTLFMYFADTVTNNDLAVQNILGCEWNGNGFGETFIAQSGPDHSSRDGMPVVTKLSDNTYAMVFEATNTGNLPAVTFVIKLSRSTDGRNWSQPVTIASPKTEIPDEMADEDGARAVCASPYITTLPDGRVAVSYQTSDLYNGTVIPTSVTRRCGVQVIVSNTAVINTTEVSESLFSAVSESPADNEANVFSKTASLSVVDGKLLCYYNDGVNTENNGDISYSTTGIKVAYADIIGNVINADDLSSFKVYSSNNKNVTLENGEYSLPDGCTKMIYADTVTNTITDRTAVEGLYSQDSYVTKGNSETAKATVDSENSSITMTGQSRNYIVGTENMTSFYSKLTMNGASTGLIYGGIGLHMQTADFSPETFAFSTSGYTVFVKRSAGESKITVMVRFITGASVKKEINTEFPDFLSTSAADKVVLTVEADTESFYVTVTNEDGTKTTGRLTYPIDITSYVSNMNYYPSGAFMLTANGTHTITDFELYNTTSRTEEVFDIVEASNVKAHALFTLPVINPSADYQVGYDLRVKQAENAAPGLTGYAIKIYRGKAYTNGQYKLQLTRYGENSSGTANANLGEIKTTDFLTAGLDQNATGAQQIYMDAVTKNEILYVTLTNPNNSADTVTEEFDLSKNSTKSSVTYNTYYKDGGFGIYAYGNSNIKVSDITFEKLPVYVNGIDASQFTVYSPDESAGLIPGADNFVSSDTFAKKAILNDTTVFDFNADATFKIGTDGQLKGGIIFRAQSIGNGSDDMEGYSCVLYKTPNNTNNYGRIVLIVYKWVRQADGTLSYLGTVDSEPNLITLNSVYPEAKNNILASAGVDIKLKLQVIGNTATASFDVLDKNNEIAASSGNKSFDLSNVPNDISSAKTFTEDAKNTVFNAGAVGVSISTNGEICDFNLTDNKNCTELFDSANTTVYKDSSNNGVTVEKDKITSTTVGNKQLVINCDDINEFDSEFTLKSTSAGATYNMGMDFCIDSNSHSGFAYNTSNATMGYDGYRLVLVRNANTNANPAGTTLYLFKFSYSEDSGYTRTQIVSKGNTDFFADYDKYGSIEVNIAVSLKNGILTASAVMKEYPERIINLSYTGIVGSGKVGYFISGGGAVISPSVRYNFASEMLYNAILDNGFVYEELNSGAAAIGDTVKVVPVAAKGYETTAVYYSVGGVKTPITLTENGYLFTKSSGATTLSADFTPASGDLNSDGAVDSLDVAAMKKILLGTSSDYIERAYLNEDNFVDIIDFIRLKKLVAAATN